MAFSLPQMATTLLSMTLYGPVTKPPRTVRPTPSLIQMQMDGGDLEHGLSQDRNADIQRLKKLFYSPSAEGSEEDAASGEAAAAESWLLRDIPMARWSVALLPHQQVLLNVFQPEYVHMFEALLAMPQPWYYMHTLLPGGVEHLGHPDYALPGLGGADGDGDAPGEGTGSATKAGADTFGLPPPPWRRNRSPLVGSFGGVGSFVTAGFGPTVISSMRACCWAYCTKASSALSLFFRALPHREKA